MWAALAVPLIVALLAPPAPLLGLHVPWAAGGLHIDHRGETTTAAEPWPQMAVPAVRLWDTRTLWADLEPADDQWEFDHLDAHVAVAEAHGTEEILLVLGGTPGWAARDPEAAGAPWLPVGSASPPRSIQAWRDYVRTVATRYAGRITAYQIGNEPNLSWFWQGTPRDLARLTTAAATEIHRVDPAATVVGAGPVVSSRDDVFAATRWWRALAGTGIDAHALQWYPALGTKPGELVAIVARMRTEVTDTANHGTQLPVWLTEVNHRVRAVRSARVDADLVEGTMRAAGQAGISRVYWYAWTRLGPPGLMPVHADSRAARAMGDYVRAEISRSR